jgi:hypothetical protein
VCCFPVPTNFGNAASSPSTLLRDISTNCLETSAAVEENRDNTLFAIKKFVGQTIQRKIVGGSLTKNNCIRGNP